MRTQFDAAQRMRLCRALAILLCGFSLYSGLGADLEQARQQLISGDYTGCINAAKAVLKQREDEDWQVLLCQAYRATGQYPAALVVASNAVAQARWNLRVLWEAREVFLCNGMTNRAAEMQAEVLRNVPRRPSSFREAGDMVIFGRAALTAGIDAKQVLDTVFKAAEQADPREREVYLARGNLALEKHDYSLAAKAFEQGLKLIPNDPDLECGEAKAFAPSDAAAATAALEASLSHNSNHIGSLLLLANHCIDAEDYDGAEEFLDRIKAVNPWEPQAWAYRAVVAALQERPEDEASARAAGLKFAPANPLVDFVIGQKLSQNYRFREGAEHQKQALAFDANYLPAKTQLAQDLLRLGDESEGWELADEVQKADNYDVEAYNLTMLHDTMAKFATVTNADFLVRMGRHEAEVYGERALALLSRARSNLCAKYGFQVKRPTMVEIFPEQKDFAVRTFGMPGNPGYLGVCFGSVITANSPAANGGHDVNWQSVLWHEFCHVVTLQKTSNKMPRWLSEGISVFEEREANPSWGEHMNPEYREMILGDDLTPVSKLSAAFLSPPSAEHLQFAYFESSLVVEYIVRQFGLEHLKAILTDLGKGVEINHALAAHTRPMEKLDADFEAYARDLARKYGPTLDWEKPAFAGLGTFGTNSAASRTNGAARGQGPRRRAGASGANRGPLAAKSDEQFKQWAASHPTNYYALVSQAQDFMDEKNFRAAKVPLNMLIERCPEQSGSEGAYPLLAAAHREMGETNEERQVLAQWVEHDDKALDAYSRLIDLDTAEQDWSGVVENANRYLAVNPLVLRPYRSLAAASEKLGSVPDAISAYAALLQLDPPNPVELHFKLAQALHQQQQPTKARRHLLEALEDAPRYREALALLLEMDGSKPGGLQ